jgi:hypothetical protein
MSNHATVTLHVDQDLCGIKDTATGLDELPQLPGVIKVREGLPVRHRST